MISYLRQTRIRYEGIEELSANVAEQRNRSLETHSSGQANAEGLASRILRITNWQIDVSIVMANLNILGFLKLIQEGPWPFRVLIMPNTEI